MNYSIGTVTISKNSNIVKGQNTYFQLVAKAEKGNLLYLHYQGAPLWLQISEVISDVELRVVQLDGKPFLPTMTREGLGYGLIQHFTSAFPAKLAANLVEILQKWYVRESEFTGWFASEEESFTITTLLGEKKALPTPLEIKRLYELNTVKAAEHLSSIERMLEEIASASQYAKEALDASKSAQSFAQNIEVHANVSLEAATSAATSAQTAMAKAAGVEKAVEVIEGHERAASASEKAAHDHHTAVSKLRQTAEASEKAALLSAASAANAAQSSSQSASMAKSSEIVAVERADTAKHSATNAITSKNDAAASASKAASSARFADAAELAAKKVKQPLWQMPRWPENTQQRQRTAKRLLLPVVSKRLSQQKQQK
ncbi:hypothetical protein [Pseudoalteromonas xiamenensis]